MRVLHTKRCIFLKNLSVVGSEKWIQKKNLNITVEALNMSYDEDISAVEAVNKLNERAQAKLNEGI